jgi:hypothetical protein
VGGRTSLGNSPLVDGSETAMVRPIGWFGYALSTITSSWGFVRRTKERTSRKHSINGFARARPVREVRVGTARYPRVEAVRLQTLPTGNSNSSSDSGFISMLYPGISGGM